MILKCVDADGDVRVIEICEFRYGKKSDSAYYREPGSDELDRLEDVYYGYIYSGSEVVFSFTQDDEGSYVELSGGLNASKLAFPRE